MKQKMKAILLSRVSTPGQDTEAQSNELIRAAEADGYKWVLIENKESAIKLTEEERQGLNDMKSLIEKGGIGADRKKVWDIVRESWRLEDLREMREIVRRYITKVTLEYVKEGSKDKLITIEQADGRVIRLVKKAYKNEVRYEDGRAYDLKVLELHRY